ncbi:MAG: hypothetical protein ACLU30_11300 [Odoribacter splanchnicus]
MKWLYYLFIVSLLLFSCKGQNVKNKRPTRLLTDALQREVALPDTIRQLVCIRSSAIRLVTYAGGAPLICGVEEQETRPNEFTHIFAHPDLARLPIIGPGMGRSRTHYGSRAGCDIHDFDHCRRGRCSAETDGNSRIYH